MEVRRLLRLRIMYGYDNAKAEKRPPRWAVFFRRGVFKSVVRRLEDGSARTYQSLRERLKSLRDGRLRYLDGSYGAKEGLQKNKVKNKGDGNQTYKLA